MGSATAARPSRNRCYTQMARFASPLITRFGRVAVVSLDDENVNASARAGSTLGIPEIRRGENSAEWEAEARSAHRELELPAAQRHAPWEFRSAQRGRAGGFTNYSNETVAQCIAAMHRKPVPVAASATATPASPTSTPRPAPDQGQHQRQRQDLWPAPRSRR